MQDTITAALKAFTPEIRRRYLAGDPDIIEVMAQRIAEKLQ